MSSNAFFALHPVFTRAEWVRHMAEQSGRTPNEKTVKALLEYHQKTGRILAIRKGLFVAVRPGSTPVRTPLDAYLLATRAYPEGLLAYHTALELHGLAHSTFESVQILVPGNLRRWEFRGLEFHPVQPRKTLGTDAFHFGVEKMDWRGFDLPVTTQARTLVDCLDRPDLAGGWEETWRSLEKLRWVDMAEVASYLRRLGNATTAAVTGFFLEQHQDRFAMDGANLEDLESLRPKGRHYLDREQGGRLSSRWNLIVPDAIWNRTWEEPL